MDDKMINAPLEIVTAADRKAAADWLATNAAFNRAYLNNLRDGEWDDHSLVQAFARHRMAK